MAHMVLKDAKVTINTVDLSDHVRAVNLTYRAEALDDTCMGDDTRTRLAGLKDWSLSIDFAQDFAATDVDATLFPLVGAAAFAVSIIPVNDTVSATNPNFNGNVILEEYPILSGSVGDLATISVTFQPAGDLSRTTSP